MELVVARGYKMHPMSVHGPQLSSLFKYNADNYLELLKTKWYQIQKMAKKLWINNVDCTWGKCCSLNCIKVYITICACFTYLVVSLCSSHSSDPRLTHSAILTSSDAGLLCLISAATHTPPACPNVFTIRNLWSAPPGLSATAPTTWILTSRITCPNSPWSRQCTSDISLPLLQWLWLSCLGPWPHLRTPCSSRFMFRASSAICK